MKNIRNKLGLAVIFFLLLSLSACSIARNNKPTQSTQNSSQAGSLQTTFPEDILKSEIGKAKVDWVYYESLTSLVDSCDQIFIGYISKIGTPFYVNNSELGFEHEGETLLLPCEIEVGDVIKGNLEQDAVITINQMMMVYDESQILVEGDTHLFFIRGNPEERVDSIQQYVLEPPMVGYPKIENETISIYEGNNLLSDGQSVTEVKSLLNDILENE